MDVISIIVPVYNAEKWLKRCIDSLTHQTYENIEIILIDDGSSDSSGSICDSLALTDNRIVVIHKQNEGVSKARNVGMDIATGDYIGFVDSDDWVEADMFEYLHDLIMSDSNAACAICGFTYSDQSENKEETEYIIKEDEESFLYMWDIPFCWNKLYRKSVINQNIKVRFDTRMKSTSDSLFNFMVMTNNSRIYIGNNTKYHYCFNDNSITATGGSLTKLYGYKYMSDTAEIRNMKIKNIYRCGYTSQLVRAMLSKEVSENKSVYIKIRKEIRKKINVYIFTNYSRLKGKVLIKMKLLALAYCILPYSFGKSIAR